MSTLTNTFSSSIGKKAIMGLTGLSLLAFLVVHCGINALIFANDGGELFNHAAEFMGTNWIMRTLEVGLFAGLILHIVQAYILTKQNSDARPVKYAASDANNNSKWYSRSMTLLGTLLLMFLIIHLRHFWVVSRFTDHITSGEETLYGEMKEVFANLWVVIVYVLSQISLAYHLKHGFTSAFQTMGWNHKKYTPLIATLGFWYAIIIPILFAAMPVALYFGWV